VNDSVDLLRQERPLRIAVAVANHTAHDPFVHVVVALVLARDVAVPVADTVVGRVDCGCDHELAILAVLSLSHTAADDDLVRVGAVVILLGVEVSEQLRAAAEIPD